MGSSWRWEGAWAALAKSSLVAFSSVPWMQEGLMDLGWKRGFLVGNHPKFEEKPWKSLRKPLENHGTPQHFVVNLHFF